MVALADVLYFAAGTDWENLCGSFTVTQLMTYYSTNNLIEELPRDTLGANI